LFSFSNFPVLAVQYIVLPSTSADRRNSTIPPFDRHDWVVTRPDPSNPSASTRYVIDYYSASPDEDGNPVFSLDVRPALDSLGDINERIRVGLGEWMKGDKAE
jgi:cytochrome c heme-lyase